MQKSSAPTCYLELCSAAQEAAEELAQEPAQEVPEPQAKAPAAPPLVPYSVIVQTADEPEAGTSGSVTLQMFGCTGEGQAGRVSTC